MDIQGPRVLFIGPKTFGYENEIKRELEQAGYRVDWHDERPSASSLVKALIRVHPGFAAPLSNAYFDRIFSNALKVDYQIVFVVKGEALPLGKLAEFRKSMPNARFIYYTWDSFKNVKNAYDKLPYFDKIYSFDRFDCLLDQRIKHLPLFYTKAYEELAAINSGKESPIDIDLLLLGSIHSDRYSVAQKIYYAAKSVMPDVCIHKNLYFQSRWVFAIKKIIDPEFRLIPWENVAWKALNTQQTVALVARSRILIDVHHPKQTGLTMRMLESVGAQKKIITTNPDVKNYDFYQQDNILVVDRNNPEIPEGFLRQPYKPLDNNIYARYSLRMWVKEIFSV